MSQTVPPVVSELIQALNLEPHQEGGYFTETFRHADSHSSDRPGGTRSLLTSIFYMLTADRPVGYMHRNQSDIVHYFHDGSPLTYHLIDKDGGLHRYVLGADHQAGHVRQLVVPGGWWKATVLESGEYGLLGEAVAPGFDYQDMQFASASALAHLAPETLQSISPYVRDPER